MIKDCISGYIVVNLDSTWVLSTWIGGMLPWFCDWCMLSHATLSLDCSRTSAVPSVLARLMAPKKPAKRAARGSEETLDVVAIKRLKSALRSRQGQPTYDELSKAYAEADHAKKAEILEKFAEDSKMSWASSFLSSSTSLEEDADHSQYQWLTKQQIAKEEALNVENPEDDEQLGALLQDLKAKDHWSPSLAAKGVQVYHYSKAWSSSARSTATEHRVQEMLVNAPKAKSKPKAKASAALPAMTVDWAVACEKQRHACVSNPSLLLPPHVRHITSYKYNL